MVRQKCQTVDFQIAFETCHKKIYDRYLSKQN